MYLMANGDYRTIDTSMSARYPVYIYRVRYKIETITLCIILRIRNQSKENCKNAFI